MNARLRSAAAIAVVLGSLLGAALPAHAATGVAIIGDGSPAAAAIAQRILLDERLERADLASAQLIWVVGASLEPERWHALLGRVRDGAGLIVVAGQTAPQLEGLALSSDGRRDGPASLSVDATAGDALAEEVVWPTAPQVGARWAVRVRAGGPLALRVSTESGRATGAAGDAVLLAGRLGGGRIALLTIALTDPSNRELILWPYFNYLLHVLSSDATGTQPDSFARWPQSPVPGWGVAWILAPLLGAAWVLTLMLFFRVRRYSRQHPEVLDSFFANTVSQIASRGGKARVAWLSIGFVRPLAGFLTLVAILFVLFAPFYWLTNIVIPNQVQPFPQAKGIWEFSWEALQVAWFLFDAGTFVAFVKYFAEYRVRDPREAVRSAQFFVWWQILTGLVQVTFACLAAIVILPHTRYGYSSNFVILVALGQYPGFFGVITFFFSAYQRFDYNIGLDLLSDWVLRFLLQIPFVLLFRAWGAANPRYGEALGAALGIGIGYHVSTILTFGIGVLLYRRLGLRMLPLFMAHFDLATAKRMLSFGLRVVAGKVFFRAAQTIDKVVISLLLINYTEWLGLKSQIHYNLMFLFPVAYRFFETAMAALSEAYGNGKRTLTQYYVARFVQIGSLYTAIGLSLLVALGPLFVRQAMDPQWARAADYLVIAACIGAFYAAAWLSDMLQKGAGRPGLFAIILGVEQALRIGLFYILIPRYQFTGFYLALLLTIALKVVVAWIVNHLVIIRVRVYAWQMLAAPALAGIGNFLVLRLIAGTLPEDAGRWTVSVLFFAAALLSFLACFFLAGLVGGFDRALADELEQASRMTGALKPLTRLFYHCARAGWTLSPLHDRFPLTIHGQAMAEAQDLERQRSESMQRDRESW